MEFPSGPSSPEERSVLVFASVVVLALLGCVALYFAWFRNPPPDVAAQLRTIGFSCFGLAGGMVVVRWVIGILLDG